MAGSEFNVTYASATTCPAAWSWFGYESPGECPPMPSQFWRHFKKCLRDIPEIIPVARICEVILRPIFAMRSHPRWRSRRWKAKT